MKILVIVIFCIIYSFVSYFEISIFITQFYNKKRMFIIEKQELITWNKNILFLCSCMLLCLSIGFAFYNLEVACMIMLIASVVNFIQLKKIKFRFTRRSLTLLITTILLLLLLLINPYIVIYFSTILLILFPSVFCIFADILVYPLEWFIRFIYMKKAKKRLKMNPNLKIVGITGSYGKTSFKNYLFTLMYGKCNVIKTPGSVNTPMGICKFINNTLTPYDDFLILELGVDAPKTMKIFFKFLTVDVGVITSIGSMHLATFKTLENIKKEKMTLFSYVKDNSAKFYNSDSFSLDTKSNEIQKYSFNDISVIKQDENGTTFVMANKEYHVPILGKHQLTNLVGAIKVARYLKISLDSIVDSLQFIKAEPHRMSIEKIQNLVIIDDSYNANYMGMTEAIKVVDSFVGKKGIILNGLIELGEESDKKNYDIGTKLINFDEIVVLDSSPKGLFEALESNKKKYKVFANYQQGFHYLKSKNLNYILLCSNAHIEYIK